MINTFCILFYYNFYLKIIEIALFQNIFQIFFYKQVLILFGIEFHIWYEVGIQLLKFIYCPKYPSIFYQKVCPFPASFKYCLQKCMGLLLSSFCSFTLFSLVPVPDNLKYYNFIEDLVIWWRKFFKCIFFPIIYCLFLVFFIFKCILKSTCYV